MDASSRASGTYGDGGYVSGKRDVGVGGAQARLGADGEVTVDGAEGVEKG